MASILYPVVLGLVSLIGYFVWLYYAERGSMPEDGDFNPVFKLFASFVGIITGIALLLNVIASLFSLKLFELDYDNTQSAIAVGGLAFAYYSFCEIRETRKTFENVQDSD